MESRVRYKILSRLSAILSLLIQMCIFINARFKCLNGKRGVGMMAKQDYLAKTFGKIQTIEEHTNEVMQLLNGFFDIYGGYFNEKEKELIRLACEYHDLGKMNQKFQDKIRRNKTRVFGEIPHGVVSVLFLNEEDLESKGFDDEDFRCLTTAIMHHHTRSFDLDSVEVSEYIRAYLQKQANDYFEVEHYPLDPDNVNKCLFDFGEIFDHNHQEWLKYVLIKGILNKADYAASNVKEILVEHPVPSGERSLNNLILKQLNGSLYPAQEFLKAKSDENVILVAPAGSGKTEGSLLWAGENKTFFALPLKVSSNSIYDRVKVRYGFEEVALLHSDALSYQIKTESRNLDSIFSRYEEMLSLSYPLTICTVDQLFKFVFKSIGTEVIAATFRYSKIIIDEIQSYHPKVMAYLCYGIKLIHELGGKFLIMTATLPPMITSRLKDEGVPFVEKTFVDLNAGIRHILKIQGDSSKNLSMDTTLILKQAKEKKVLVLCNTVKKAQAVYKELIDLSDDDSVPIRLLHSRFIKKHRAELEKEILSFAKNGRMGGNGIWISTQIVEASLDIDFDVLHTEMCTIDSLFQRMGRCYRSRTLEGTDPNIYIYPTQNGSGSIYDKEIYERSLSVVAAYEGLALSESDKMKMVKEVYDEDVLKTSEYYQTFDRALKELEEIQPGTFSKREGDYLFREINSITVLPDAVLNETGVDCVEEYLSIMQDRNHSLKKRHEAKQALIDLTTTLTLYGKLPKGVDSGLIDDGSLSIHRTTLKYDYDPIEKKGLGLVLDEFEEDDQFI